VFVSRVTKVHVAMVSCLLWAGIARRDLGRARERLMGVLQELSALAQRYVLLVKME
jgi:hypothetical protein